MKLINYRSVTDPRRAARTRRRAPGLGIGPPAGAIVAAVLIAGCGGSPSGGGVAHNNAATTAKSSTKSTVKASRVAFAQCMRTHGEPSYPDPSSSGGPAAMPQSVNPNSRTLQAASNVCRSLEPAGVVSASQSSKAMATALRFATCMQKNGVPNYPDPKTTNNGTAIQQSLGSGVNPNSPAFQAAEKKCGAGQPATSRGGS